MHKRTVPLLLATIAGLVPILSSVFTTPGNVLQAGNDWFEQSLIIIFGFALLLGTVNVVQLNLNKIYRKQSGWPYAAVLLVALFGMGIVGLNQAIMGHLHEPGVWQGPRAGVDETLFEWLQGAIYKPLQATMFALLAFYLASAAFRAFRVRNVEATVLLVAAMVVMLGVNPFGIMLFSWMPSIGTVPGTDQPLIPGGQEFMPWLTAWLMNVPNTAAQRGIIIGAALGAAAMSLRVLLGIERSYLGLGKD